TIRTEAIDEAARITITDTGIGLTEELRHRVFDPFFTTKEVGKGTGLGLSVSHGIVTGHGGEIQILPTEVGAAFQVDLPIHDGMETPSRTPSQIDPAPGGSWRILVVDDEATVLDVIGRLLRSEGHRVSTAPTVADALALLEQTGGAFDVVLSDYRMPDMDGAEFHEILEGRFPDLVRRLIFVTGDGANKLTHDFLQKKDCLYINKPFRLDEFRRALHRSVRSKSRRPVPSREVWLFDADPSVAEILTTAIYDVTGSSAPLRTLRTAELLLEDLRKFIPRMLLLDLGNTEPPGLDLVRMIKRMHPEVRLVALCHHARRREAERALAAGVEEYLLKPVRGREAALILEKILS
ncbi:MAG: response regulator, partial [Planctomycetota bacterium]|nr:response regulator [Planctomycetota bacterium]